MNESSKLYATSADYQSTMEEPQREDYMSQSSITTASGRERSSSRRPDTGTVFIDVLNFILVKHVIEEDGKLYLIGTMIQNVFQDDLDEPAIKFDYRFNDLSAEEGMVVFRRKEEKKYAMNLTPETAEAQNEGTLHRYTNQVKLPLEMDVEFDCFPFRILSAKCMIELSTPTTTDFKTRLRPNLMLHQDKRNATNIQEDPFAKYEKGTSEFEKAMDKIDRTTKYDFVSPFPKMTYLYDTKKKYCPKYQINFLMVEDGLKKFVEIVVPMLLICVMNTINVSVYEPEEKLDYLGNSATFALTVVIYLPFMIGETRRQEFFNSNNAYMTFILVALTLSSFPSRAWSIFGAVMFWMTFLFPLVNFYRYLMYIETLGPTKTPAQLFCRGFDNYKGFDVKKEGKAKLVTVQNLVEMHPNESGDQEVASDSKKPKQSSFAIQVVKEGISELAGIITKEQEPSNDSKNVEKEWDKWKAWDVRFEEFDSDKFKAIEYGFDFRKFKR